MFRIACILLLTLIFTSCGRTPIPKPYQYPRIDFHAKKYQEYDSVCPFQFEYPVYSKIEPDTAPDAQPCYLNIQFPDYNATLHLTYQNVDNSEEKLYELTEDAFKFVTKHNVKAEAFVPKLITRPEAKVYGIHYDLQGDVASATQFFVTDSTQHYLRGALYFNTEPNADSLAPVVDYLNKDIDRLVQTLQWK